MLCYTQVDGCEVVRRRVGSEMCMRDRCRLATRGRGWGAMSTGAASVGREQTDVEGSGRKRRFRALLLRFLRWLSKEFALATYNFLVDGEKKDDHLVRSQAEEANHWPRGRAKVRSRVLNSTRER